MDKSMYIGNKTLYGRKWCYDKSGYLVSKDGKQHRVIYEREVGHIPMNHHIHHINGIKDDNRVENLMCIEAGEHSRMHMIGKHIGNTYWLGKKHTQESKDKMSKAKSGCIFTQEHRDNLSKAKIGRTYTQEYKDKMSVSIKEMWRKRKEKE